MGLLDNLGNLSPEQTQGLLGFASNMLQAGGPSRIPIGFGQALGAGLQGYQGASDAARRQKLEEEQAKQIAELRAMQIQEAQGSLQQQQFMQDRQRRIQSGLAGLGGNQSGMAAAQMGGGAQDPAGQQPMASAAPGIGPMSPKTGGPDWLQAYQEQQQSGQIQAPQPVQQPQRKNSTEAYAQRLIAEAEIYSREGDFDGADKRYQLAVKMLPQVDKIETAMQNGQPVRVITFKDGTEKVSSFDAKPDMVEIGLGDRKQFVDKNRVTNGQSFKMGIDPGTIYSGDITMRGQNMTDGRARDFNAVQVEANNINRAEKREVANMTKNSQIASFDTMLGTLGRLSSHPGLSRSVGIMGKLPTVPGSDSANFQAELDTFQSQAFIPMVAQLKGMGALSDAEGKKLTAAVGALNPNMGEKAFRESVGRINADMEAARDRVSGTSGAQAKPTPAAGKIATLADIAETARKSGRTTAEVTAKLKELGYTIGGR